MNDLRFVKGLNSSEQIVFEQKLAHEKTTQEHQADYLASLQELEDAMEPYKEQKRDLKTEYVENGWLTKDEISLTVKAYRLVKNNLEDLDELLDMVEALRGKV
tara:strand:+ start:180 stop:488 length:309 start_codon:yes stop_codon:yes gene_type:complete